MSEHICVCHMEMFLKWIQEENQVLKQGREFLICPKMNKYR